MTFGEGLSIVIIKTIFTCLVMAIALNLTLSLSGTGVAQSIEEVLDQEPDVRVSVLLSLGITLSLFGSMLGIGFITNLILKKS